MIEPDPMDAPATRTGVVLDFARSELFERTFADGMELVEDAAGYLDGPGRQDSKLLSRQAALAYAGESMRLTTRLMKLASWLLVQRAVREGNMTAKEACEPRYRITEDEDLRGPAAVSATQDPLLAELPSGILDLSDRSERLHVRVMHLDRRMYVDPTGDERPHPVAMQMDRLREAFGD